MNKISSLLLVLLLTFSVYPTDKKVLVEVFTNSHCTICPSAHSALNAYAANGTYKNQITYIYYHMSFPYSDDPLNQHNTADPAARNSYYGPFSSTPRAMFAGTVQNNNYSAWGGILDGLAQQVSPLEITLYGSVAGNQLSITANVKQTAAINDPALVIQFVAVENVNYTGRNGISVHKNVMRKMFPGNGGQPFTPVLNQNVPVNNDLTLSNVWNTSELGFVVFVQDTRTKEVLQSQYISYTELVSTTAEEETIRPFAFNLEQNYPNPFNPSTTINYTIENGGFVTLSIHNVIGETVAVLVNRYKNAGRYSADFTADNLQSGIYFYKLQSGSSVITKKMLLVK